MVLLEYWHKYEEFAPDFATFLITSQTQIILCDYHSIEFVWGFIFHSIKFSTFFASTFAKTFIFNFVSTDTKKHTENTEKY